MTKTREYNRGRYFKEWLRRREENKEKETREEKKTEARINDTPDSLSRNHMCL